MFSTVSASRLSTARESRGLTKRALAEMVGVTPQAITNYESGEDSYDARLDRVSEILDFPREFFLLDDLEAIHEGAVSFRARRDRTVKVTSLALGRSKLAAGVASRHVRERFALPEADVPSMAGDDPETAAAALRRAWGLGSGPIDNMVHLLEAKGVEVYWLAVESRSVDAFCYSLGRQPFVFLNLHKPAGERGRFDAAHELGHLVLHQDVEPGRIDSQEVEAEANAFASAFLMPREQFREELPRIPALRHYVEMKPRWKTSVQAMVKRAHGMGAITDWAYQSAYRDMSRLGWRTTGVEPGQLPREESHLHELMFQAWYDEGVSVEEVARRMRLPLDCLFELMPASKAFADGRLARVGNLRLELDSAGSAP